MQPLKLGKGFCHITILSCFSLLFCDFLFYLEVLPSCVMCCFSFPPFVWIPALILCPAMSCLLIGPGVYIVCVLPDVFVSLSCVIPLRLFLCLPVLCFYFLFLVFHSCSFFFFFSPDLYFALHSLYFVLTFVLLLCFFGIGTSQVLDYMIFGTLVLSKMLFFVPCPSCLSIVAFGSSPICHTWQI